MAVTVAEFDAWLRAFAAAVHDNVAYLTELDAAIGDADHGTNLDRGMRKVVEVLDAEDFAQPDALFKKVGMTLVSSVGGASGALYGTFFLRFGTALADTESVSFAELGSALRAGVGGILARGKAELGDKTMCDAWAPAIDAYDAAADDVGHAIDAAAEAAEKAKDATTDLVARKGRASYLGERSAGHIDPGAASTALLLRSAQGVLR